MTKKCPKGKILKHGKCVANIVDYSHIPEEIFGYAVDQAYDRQIDDEWKELEGITVITGVDIPEQKQIEFWDKKGRALFEQILEEKRHDVHREVRHGERQDYTRGYIDALKVKGKFVGDINAK